MSKVKEKKQIKREHFNNLIAVALADGVLHDDEIQFFTERGQEFGLMPEEIDEVIQEGDNLEFMVPMNKEDREEQLSDSVFIMMVDGHISEREYQLCLKIGEKLDFRPKDVDKIIELVRQLWHHAG